MKRIFQSEWSWGIVISVITYLIFSKLNMARIIFPLSQKEGHFLINVFVAFMAGIILTYIIGFLFFRKEKE